MLMHNLFKSAEPAVPVRGLHLDLKGVPPTPARLLSLMDVAAAARYNAVLVEWEDTFPWTVDERFRCETAYTPEEVAAFHAKCADLGIEVIPLVQCLGHMETPLTVPDYRALREVPHLSNVLNPLAPGARDLVQAMVDDVIALTPGIAYFHLGGDEAWTFGSHPDTKAFIEPHGKAALYMRHVEPILDSLNERGVRPILWHDMMVDWDAEALERLGAKADLLVWGYRGHPDQTTGKHRTAVSERFLQHGVRVWGGTAYKGADGLDADRPNLEQRRTNGIGWAEVAKRLGAKGVFATAWSRYATHTVQCEPIDACLDFLVAMGVWLHDAADVEGGLDAAAEALEEIGERGRFAACRDAMADLSIAREKGWSATRRARQAVACEQQDPRRRGFGQATIQCEALRVATTNAEKAAEAARSAFDGLIAPVWIERYLGERIAPLRDELAEIAPLAEALEPEIYEKVYDQ